ncbi:tRNA pseudouridine(55) synthase TruB [Kineothrix sp. MB12-C1]|uniref:tRNA pseudouridine(55) synthase TruB n=1 Tax=Kineothrix sp. MB12-C1 TaxID=3070215 RepID=UPI0027D28E31|nr:tRNA pseudouridine(55) synthase TruB [Kineothrix sp. MB12-C1]WMC92956.1 tRNA pseudouridine(55) synthase TruB [Kineothrix sp. MB12-C1]
MYNGIINIYKEAGFTSHDVVAKLRGILKQKKIGHTGTLDPDAVGVLPVCLGSATKLCDMLTDKSKEYRVRFLLGRTTDTQDSSGQVLTQSPVTVTEAQVTAVIHSFLGDYDQVPPMYSAIKVDGKRLYQLAREGKEIERKSRQVHIEYIHIEELALPEIAMVVGCSKGTYIRTLCHDIGQELGCGAVMTHLERSRVGEFLMEEALPLSEVEQMVKEGTIDGHILPVERIFADYRKVTVDDRFRKLIDNGNAFYEDMIMESGACIDGESVRVYSQDNRFYGIFAYSSYEKRFKPVKMFME